MSPQKVETTQSPAQASQALMMGWFEMREKGQHEPAIIQDHALGLRRSILFGTQNRFQDPSAAYYSSIWDDGLTLSKPYLIA